MPVGTKRNTNAQSSTASSSQQQQHHNRLNPDMDSLQMSVSEVRSFFIIRHFARARALTRCG